MQQHPTDTFGSVDPNERSMATASAWKSDPPADLPIPPVTSEAEAAMVRDVWSQMSMGDEPQPAAAFGGWPTEFKDVAPAAPALALPPTDDLGLASAPPTGLEPIAATVNPAPSNVPPPGIEPVAVPTEFPPPPGRPPSHVDVPGERRRTELPGGIYQGAPSAPPPRPAHDEVQAAIATAPPRMQIATPVQSESFTARAADTLGDKENFKRLMFGLVGAAAVVLGVALYFMRGPGADPVVIKAGTLSVTSEPAGAKIFLNGRDIEQRTPSQITALPLDVPMKLSLTLYGHIAVPEEVSVQIPSDTGKTAARFVFDRARVFRLETDPPGASVTVNDEALSGGTPLDLPPTRYGDSATVSVSLEGFLPGTLVLDARPDTATVATLTLEAALKIDIVTDPPGATVWIDGKAIGETPAWAVPVPSRTAFRLKVNRRGFKPFSQRYVGTRIKTGRIEIPLADLPLLDMPLTAAERRDAKQLGGQLAQARRALRASRASLQRSEAALDALQRRGTSKIALAARAHDAVNEARSQVELRESEQDEAIDLVEQFRATVLARLRAQDLE